MESKKGHEEPRGKTGIKMHPLRRIRAGEGEGAFYLSRPFFHDDPLQDIMCKLCYYVYG